MIESGRKWGKVVGKDGRVVKMFLVHVDVHDLEVSKDFLRKYYVRRLGTIQKSFRVLLIFPV